MSDLKHNRKKNQLKSKEQLMHLFHNITCVVGNIMAQSTLVIAASAAQTLPKFRCHCNLNSSTHMHGLGLTIDPGRCKIARED